MTEERKQQLIGLLKNASRNADGSIVYMQGSDARDILAMLTEGDEPSSNSLQPPTIGAQSFGDCAEVPNGGSATFWSFVAPTITFKPYDPPKPMLDQMPEGDYHFCADPVSPHSRVWVARFAKDAHYQLADGGVGGVCSASPGKLTVLDADPPQPKTLADVPSGVWCRSGAITSRPGFVWVDLNGDVQFLADANGKSCRASAFEPCEVAITRVLGTPVLNAEVAG